MEGAIIIAYGVIIPISWGLVFAFFVVWAHEKNETERMKKLGRKIHGLCSECYTRDMPVTYPDEASAEPVCWKCLAGANWVEIIKLRKEQTDEK